MDENIKITKKPENNKRRGEDGYRTFSIRIRAELTKRLDEIADESKRSRNEIITILLEYAADRVKID